MATDPANSGDIAFVTGASGFVGSAVARALIAAGFRVRALLRPTSPRSHLAGLGLEIVEGDLRDRAAVRRGAEGARFVFHVAAAYRLSLGRSAEIFSSNVEGARTIMEAAGRAGVERIVYTSSVATLALNTDGSPATEGALAKTSDTIGAYKKSKLAAEKLVLSMANEGLPVVIVNPTAPLGPFDVRPTPTGRIVIEAACGRMPGYVNTGLNLVHVDDVAAGHLMAMRLGRIGERYILGGQDVMLWELLTAIAEKMGRRPPQWRIPLALAYPFAAAAELAGQITGREPFATINGLRMAKHKMFFSSTKAEREFGYRARPWRDALNDAIAWFRAEGKLNCP